MEEASGVETQRSRKAASWLALGPLRGVRKRFGSAEKLKLGTMDVTWLLLIRKSSLPASQPSPRDLVSKPAKKAIMGFIELHLQFHLELKENSLIWNTDRVHILPATHT